MNYTKQKSLENWAVSRVFPDELGQLLRTIEDYDGNKVVKHALQLTPLVFAHPGELRAMKWSEIDFKNAKWRYTVSKTKPEHIVLLATQALQIIQSLQFLTEHAS